MEKATDFDVIVVGAGFGGVYLTHRLTQDGLNVRVFEAGSDVGGTWYWNRYPGARCDVESWEYSYSFSDEIEREWRWSERFATQPEILSYIGHVADRFDLKRHMRFDTRVVAATFDDVASTWTIETHAGDRFTARYCIMATGCLSASRLPDIPGIDRFRGNTYRTGEWPHEEVDFTGQRVGVIGTGSSGIQAIPEIARQAEQLLVFQRTPSFSVPAKNGRRPPEHEKMWVARHRELREEARGTRSGVLHEYATRTAGEMTPAEREAELTRRWNKGGTNFMYAFTDIATNEGANAIAAEFVRRKIGEIVENPATADRLMPRDYPIGTKRICVDTDYYATFNRRNVSLIDLREAPIEEITAEGIRTRDAAYPLDAIVFATGFDAITGALLAMDIRGVGGTSLHEKWAEGPRAYLGVAIADFPNLFIITGPGSPSVISNMVLSCEHHADWIAECLTHMRQIGADRIEARREDQEAWVEHVNEVAEPTLFGKAASWYRGANIPGKPQVFMPYVGGVDVYHRRCAAEAAKGYPGFKLSTPRETPTLPRSVLAATANRNDERKEG